MMKNGFMKGKKKTMPKKVKPKKKEKKKTRPKMKY